ncbi:hypothetical protein T484DRAFT_1760539 [Baffinella frigidus]|nr:hypothetical protein T484DRAFT_1760539 [Cryptophyta sp. CCMP2293]
MQEARRSFKRCTGKASREARRSFKRCTGKASRVAAQCRHNVAWVLLEQGHADRAIQDPPVANP